MHVTVQDIAVKDRIDTILPPSPLSYNQLLSVMLTIYNMSIYSQISKTNTLSGHWWWKKWGKCGDVTQTTWAGSSQPSSLTDTVNWIAWTWTWFGCMCFKVHTYTNIILLDIMILVLLFGYCNSVFERYCTSAVNTYHTRYWISGLLSLVWHQGQVEFDLFEVPITMSISSHHVFANYNVLLSHEFTLST